MSPDNSHDKSRDRARNPAAGIGKMLVVAVCAFGFAFTLVPLYRIACEKVFGIRLEGTAAQGVDTSAVAQRLVTVQFDGGVNSKLPWAFNPNQFSMQVHPGKLYEATYYARNESDHTIVGNAVPSVAPARASGYFSKTECFCFTAQTLAAGEQRDMPVRFIIDPELPEDISTITLSYTFYKNAALTAQQQGAAKTAATPLSAP